MAGLVLVSAPTAEPLATAEAKAQLRVTLSDEDALIAAEIAAARQIVENETQRFLISQSWKLTLDYFPPWEIQLVPGLQSVDAITYVDTAGDTQTLAADQYLVDATREPGLVTPAWGNYWPATRFQMAAVQITFTAGYGDAADVPEGIKDIIRLIVGWKFQNRNGGELPWETIRALCAPYLCPYDFGVNDRPQRDKTLLALPWGW